MMWRDTCRVKSFTISEMNKPAGIAWLKPFMTKGGLVYDRYVLIGHRIINGVSHFKYEIDDVGERPAY